MFEAYGNRLIVLEHNVDAVRRILATIAPAAPDVPPPFTDWQGLYTGPTDAEVAAYQHPLNLGEGTG